jgi:hypothetical protein
MGLSFMYAGLVGFYGIFNPNACAAYYNLHTMTMDIYLPPFVTVCLLPLLLYALLRPPKDLLALVKYGLEKPIQKKRTLVQETALVGIDRPPIWAQVGCLAIRSNTAPSI